MKDVIVPLLPKKNEIGEIVGIDFKNTNQKTVAFGSLYFIGEIESLF